MTKTQIDELEKVVLRFTAPWCAPCTQYAPTFDAVSKEFELKTLVVDVSDYPELARDYGVMGIPATVFLQKGQVVSILSGNKPTESVRADFERLRDK